MGLGSLIGSLLWKLLPLLFLLKLEEVANALKEEKPELCERLQLGKPVKKEKKFKKNARSRQHCGKALVK